MITFSSFFFIIFLKQKYILVFHHYIIPMIIPGFFHKRIQIFFVLLQFEQSIVQTFSKMQNQKINKIFLCFKECTIWLIRNLIFIFTIFLRNKSRFYKFCNGRILVCKRRNFARKHIDHFHWQI